MSGTEYIEKKRVLQELLEDLAEEAGRRSGFVQRDSKMTGPNFAKTMILGSIEQPDASLNDFAQVSADLGVDITASGINQRVDAEASEMMKQLLNQVVKRLGGQETSLPEVLKSFRAVYILDSTQVALPDEMKEIFEGAGGNGPEAGVKIQLSYEYLQGSLTAIELSDGRSPDQNCTLHTQQATKDSLHLFDLGYFKQGVFAELDEAGAYFISRFHNQTAFYWQPDDPRGIDLLSFVQNIEGNQCEIQPFMGHKARLQVRLLFQRLPPEIVEERRRKARARMRRQGKTPSQRHLQLLEWNIFITNVPVDCLSFEQVFMVYRVRWQIELVFKVWKSEARLDQIGDWRTDRVLCQLYARLTGLLIFHWLLAPHRFAELIELSLTKAFQVFQRFIPRLIDAVNQDWFYVPELLCKLQTDFLRFARKDRRKKSPSTYQLLLEIGA